MAAKTQMVVGSVDWINAEKENVIRLVDQEKEELIYPAQHEMDWLNEHMSEIFRKSRFNVTDVFKTPGKLRGKTPRTGRKRDALETRMPLSDIFTSKPQVRLSLKRSSRSAKSPAALHVVRHAQQAGEIKNASLLPKQYTDSGYHGSTEDKIDVGIVAPVSSNGSPQPTDLVSNEPLRHVVQQSGGPASAERRTTEGSFHSAREDVPAKVPFAVAEKKEDDGDISCENTLLKGRTEVQTAAENLHDETMGATATSDHVSDLAQELDDIGSPSDGSTPAPRLVRKSSLNFASLPAREPLTTKKSFGATESRNCYLDQTIHGSSNSFYKMTNGSIDRKMGDGDECGQATSVDVDLAAVQAHSKSSTQRLHEKIDMLGKSQASRLSKSIPSAAALAASNLRKSEAARKAEKEASAVEDRNETGADEDEDWIKPLANPDYHIRPPLTKSHTTDVMEDIVDNETDSEDDETEFDMRAPELIAHEERMRTPVEGPPSPASILPDVGHTKSASTATLASPGKPAMGPGSAHMKTISVSNPECPSTTPKGSPRRVFDVPLSASKSKLQSIMKTAKGLFTSSAGVSAAAKMETLSPKALHIATNNMPGLYPSIAGLVEEKPLPPSPIMGARRTRSSTEREKEEKQKEREWKDRQKAEDQLVKAREKEKQNAAQFKAEERLAQGHMPRSLQAARQSPGRTAQQNPEVGQLAETHDMPPPAAPSLHCKVQRPVKPTRELAKKNRPQPMSIRVASTLSQRMPISTSSLASTLQETLPATTIMTQNVVSKKTSHTSLSSAASNPGFKSSMTSQAGKPRALLAAERKKEADERRTQRKLEQKRETERKRAAQQEEGRRQEQLQKQRAEAERKERDHIAAEQTKKTTQQPALEKRRQEQGRKIEQQRNANAANDHSLIFQSVSSAAPRHDLQASRPPSRLGATSTLNRSLLGHNLPTNHAKPPKRPHEDETGPSRPQAPRFGAASQQVDAKRRRTGEQETIEPASRPTMSGAPIRQSNTGKKPSIFSHGYAPAPNGAQLNQATKQLHQFPQPPNPQRTVQPSEMSKYANGNKIPFADAPNPPASSQHHKTPSTQPPPLPPKSILQSIKSSPHFNAGETIVLPEIPTDSEDEGNDSADEAAGGGAFPIPSWASPTTLSNQLIAQEAIDGDAVFGPIAPLRMEEIFAKGNKDRLKKFRDRTSSANWALSGDGLTIEEVRADREMRERLRREGGWRYDA